MIFYDSLEDRDISDVRPSEIIEEINKFNLMSYVIGEISHCDLDDNGFLRVYSLEAIKEVTEDSNGRGIIVFKDNICPECGSLTYSYIDDVDNLEEVFCLNSECKYTYNKFMTWNDIKRELDC